MSTVVITKKEIELMKAEPRTHFLNENAIRLCKSLGDHAGHPAGVEPHIMKNNRE